MRVFSFGGGVQSTAALVLAAQGRLEVDAFLFANVGEDSENPETLDYIARYSRPFADQHNVALHELHRIRRDGTRETVYGRIMAGKRGIVIPMHLHGSGPMRRQCTEDFKRNIIHRWVRAHGATPRNPAHILIGISRDEMLRMRSGDTVRYVTHSYPLVDMRLSRQDCMNIITAAGLLIPPKSSCYFCPFHNLQAWRDQRDKHPDLFAKSVELERYLNMAHSAPKMRKPLYLSSRQQMLEKAIGNAVQPSLFNDDDVCESGYCMV